MCTHNVLSKILKISNIFYKRNFKFSQLKKISVYCMGVFIMVVDKLLALPTTDLVILISGGHMPVMMLDI